MEQHGIIVKMSQTSDEDCVSRLVRAGILLFLGYGVYLVLKSFAEFRTGDRVSAGQIASDALTVEEEDEEAEDGGMSVPQCGYRNCRGLPDHICTNCGALICDYHYCDECDTCSYHCSASRCSECDKFAHHEPVDCPEYQDYEE